MQEAAAGWQETSEPGAIREMPLEELHSGLQALSALSGTASRAPREPHFLLRAAPYTLAEGIGLHPSASGDGGRRWGQAGEGRYFSPVPPLLSSRLAAPEFLCQEAHAPGRKAPSPGVSSGEGTALSSSWRPPLPRSQPREENRPGCWLPPPVPTCPRKASPKGPRRAPGVPLLPLRCRLARLQRPELREVGGCRPPWGHLLARHPGAQNPRGGRPPARLSAEVRGNAA